MLDRKSQDFYESDYDHHDGLAGRVPEGGVRSHHNTRPRDRRYHSHPQYDEYEERYYSGRSRRAVSASPAPRRDREGKYDKLGKVIIAVGVLQVVAGTLQLWNSKRVAKREEADRRRRQREFDRAKRARRRQEEELERREASYDDYDQANGEPLKRISYRPVSPEVSPSAARRLQLEAPPPYQSKGVSRRRSRTGSIGARSFASGTDTD